MEMKNEAFSLLRIRELDLVNLLEKLGHEPAARKKNDTDYWYLSPLRDERTPSFHIDRTANEWYDFGLMAGGNPIDFLLRYHGCSIAALLERMNVSFSPHRLSAFETDLLNDRFDRDSKLVVKEVRPLYAYPLKNYLHERSIPIVVADAYCKELTYDIGGRSYYGIGFQNNLGGWEIRNKSFKQSSAPKDVTFLSYGAGSAHVFEGFMDFLSWQALHPYQEPRSVDFVVLNGAGLFDRALSFLKQHERVHLWLDRDVTGLAYRDYALSLGNCFVDESGLYEEFKDLNDWLRCKGEMQKPILRLGGGLRPAG
ncbi:Toprim domain-containing protein [Mucilaginibacter yixingensis]|uniref:Toprim domain-containing protein n=1 Tax=Mucilaginibacter yixingensis TaxID=1295612 RepID=A0A2T5JBQ0_9SPHI|nr:toprim domain-containing protein [Mucilaginibacter yixingensis]PTQ99189.1 Toprim domain-containing protein [Mucilaginibacter yixingensis]